MLRNGENNKCSCCYFRYSAIVQTCFTHCLIFWYNPYHCQSMRLLTAGSLVRVQLGEPCLCHEKDAHLENRVISRFSRRTSFCHPIMCCDYKIDALSAGTKNPLPQSDNGFCPVRARTGAPDRIRTCDLKSRSLALYPTELQAHIWSGDPLLFILII